MKKERTVAERKQERELSERYGKIGISSVAAAARYQSDQHEKKTSRKRDGKKFIPRNFAEALNRMSLALSKIIGSDPQDFSDFARAKRFSIAF